MAEQLSAYRRKHFLLAGLALAHAAKYVEHSGYFVAAVARGGLQLVDEAGNAMRSTPWKEVAIQASVPAVRCPGRRWPSEFAVRRPPDRAGVNQAFS
eukprot:366228-Chlamydomonas_euryale.AAC.20